MPFEQAVENVAQDELTPSEEAALTSAATWYFKYHARIIAEQADEGSALADSRRERFYELHSALWKLGIRLALPDQLARSAPLSPVRKGQ